MEDWGQMSQIDENIHRILREYGLTEYQIKAYLKLVIDGPATSYEISESVKIPYARVYGTLEELEGRGWIETQPGRPVVYRAKPPRYVAHTELDRRKVALEEFSNAMARDLQAIYERRETVKHINLWVVHGGDKILEKQDELLSHAKNHAFFLLASLTGPEAQALSKSLRTARERGVNARIACFDNPRFVEKKTLYLVKDDAETVAINDPSEDVGRPLNMIVADGREVMLSFLWNLDAPSDSASRIAFRVTDEDLAGVVERYCEYYFARGKKL